MSFSQECSKLLGGSKTPLYRKNFQNMDYNEKYEIIKPIENCGLRALTEFVEDVKNFKLAGEIQIKQ